MNFVNRMFSNKVVIAEKSAVKQNPSQSGVITTSRYFDKEAAKSHKNWLTHIGFKIKALWYRIRGNGNISTERTEERRLFSIQFLKALKNSLPDYASSITNNKLYSATNSQIDTPNCKGHLFFSVALTFNSKDNLKLKISYKFTNTERNNESIIGDLIEIPYSEYEAFLRDVKLFAGSTDNGETIERLSESSKEGNNNFGYAYKKTKNQNIIYYDNNGNKQRFEIKNQINICANKSQKGEPSIRRSTQGIIDLDKDGFIKKRLFIDISWLKTQLATEVKNYNKQHPTKAINEFNPANDNLDIYLNENSINSQNPPSNSNAFIDYLRINNNNLYAKINQYRKISSDSLEKYNKNMQTDSSKFLQYCKDNKVQQIVPSVFLGCEKHNNLAITTYIMPLIIEGDNQQIAPKGVAKNPLAGLSFANDTQKRSSYMKLLDEIQGAMRSKFHLTDFKPDQLIFGTALYDFSNNPTESDSKYYLVDTDCILSKECSATSGYIFELFVDGKSANLNNRRSTEYLLKDLQPKLDQIIAMIRTTVELNRGQKLLGLGNKQAIEKLKESLANCDTLKNFIENLCTLGDSNASKENKGSALSQIKSFIEKYFGNKTDSQEKFSSLFENMI